MKKLPLVLLAIVSLFVLAGCHGDKQYDDLLQQADSIMNIDDDSAKIAIKLLDKVKPQLNDFSKAQRMRYQLLYHKAMNKADISFSSDSIMKNVVAYYEKHGTSNERMLAYYMLGCVYRDIHEAPLALEYYNKLTLSVKIVTILHSIEYIAKWEFCLKNNIYVTKNLLHIIKLQNMLIWLKIPLTPYYAI